MSGTYVSAPGSHSSVLTLFREVTAWFKSREEGSEVIRRKLKIGKKKYIEEVFSYCLCCPNFPGEPAAPVSSPWSEILLTGTDTDRESSAMEMHFAVQIKDRYSLDV